MLHRLATASLAVALLVTGVNAQTVLWVYKTTGMPHSPTLYPDASHPTGVICAADKQVALLSGQGEALWTVSFEKAVANPVTVADLDGDGTAETVAELSDATVVCLDNAGKTRWTQSLKKGAEALGLIAAADVHPEPGVELIVGRMDGWLYCLSAKGEVLWRFFGDRFRVGHAAVGDVDANGFAEIVYGTDNGDIYCLSGLGGVKWRYTEQAPYGRSGVNLADLDGDGKCEVLITRSNQGSAPCLMALDGVAGTFKWRTRDMMQSYVSNATVDLDGDGKLEVLHGDKGNWLYCTNADGSERWRTELAGRGIFWAPAVGDVNGDDKLEIIVPVRDHDPATGACYFLVGADGKVIAPVKVGTSGNASPAIGDINGDAVLEVVVSTQGPNSIQALSWGGGWKVAWPSLRGNSAMTANANVLPGSPGAAARGNSPKLTLEQEAAYCGGNVVHATWEQATPENAFAAVSVSREDGRDETRIVPLAQGIREAEIPWELPQTKQARLTVSIMASGMASTIAMGEQRVSPKPAEWCDSDQVAAACGTAMAAGKQADARGLEARLAALDAARQALKRLAATSGDDADVAAQATELREQAKELSKLARALQTYWEQQNAGSFVYWQDPNPWDRFDPMAMPDAIAADTPIKVSAFGDEFEDVALNLLNISAHPVDVRCVFAKPKLGGGAPDREPDLARHITLRRGRLVPSYKSGMVLDALPELDRSRTFTLTPGEVSQLWLIVDTHGLDAGAHTLTLYLGSLEEKSTIRETPITIEVWPVRLPEGVYAQMNWAGINPSETSDQQMKDMIDHGISVAYGPALPTLALDANGNPAGAVDWSAMDAGLARVPGYFQLLFSGPPAVKWPEGVKVEPGSALEDQGFATAVREMVKHLAEKGFGYERWAFYPMDEPWLTGPSNIPQLRTFCKRVKAADPRARNYADPTGMLRVEYLEEFKDLIDVWQPEINILKRDLRLREWFQKNAKTLWAYEATDPGKDLLPLGYYRGYAWLAWYLGLKGAGFWCYKYHDAWWPLETTDWSVVYQTNDEVTPSRRWESCRDGQEDYRMLYALRAEIAKGRTAGRTADADKAQALMDEAVEKVIAWQARTIDEITRQTRDYELDYDLLMQYRIKIADEITRLRNVAP